MGRGCAWTIGALILLAFVMTYWMYILVAVGLAIAMWFAVLFVQGWREDTAERRKEQRTRARGLRERADRQHEAALRGDRYGVFGDYPPVDLPDFPGAG